MRVKLGSSHNENYDAMKKNSGMNFLTVYF